MRKLHARVVLVSHLSLTSLHGFLQPQRPFKDVIISSLPCCSNVVSRNQDFYFYFIIFFKINLLYIQDTKCLRNEFNT